MYRRVARENMRQAAANLLLLTLGPLLGAVQVVMFMIPADIVPGGLSSLAVIQNALFGLPVGLFVLVANIPILYLGYRMLGGWPVVATTGWVVLVFSVGVDVLTLLDTAPVSDDRLLNALFGGALGGISAGIIYRAGGTYGGTSTLARIIQLRSGTPMSTTFLYTDAALIALAGLVFGWESALYAVVALVIGGMTADYMMEGPSVIRTVFIITERPDAIADMVIRDLHRTVTAWQAKGMYSHTPRTVLYVTIPRSEAALLRDYVLAVDPTAFVVIGQGHTAYGAGFRRSRSRATGGTAPAVDQPD